MNKRFALAKALCCSIFILLSGCGGGSAAVAPKTSASLPLVANRIAFSGSGISLTSAAQSDVNLPVVPRGFEPALSPDGARIAYFSNENIPVVQLFVVGVDGTNNRQITFGDAAAVSPAWSPDGAQLAFRRDDAIYLINADGTNSRRVPNTQEGEYPSWLPTGNRISFERRSEAIHIIDLDGSNEEICRSSYLGHSWSPDGRYLAHIEGQGGKYGATYDLYISEVGTTRKTKLTQGNFNREPSFSPDGKQIVFTRSSSSANPSEVVVMNVDGTNLRVLASGSNPSWGR